LSADSLFASHSFHPEALKCSTPKPPHAITAGASAFLQKEKERSSIIKYF